MPTGTSLRLPRLAVALLAAGTSVLGPDVARGAGTDLNDPIPATVGPPGGVSFYINTNAPGLDKARVESLIRRSLVRWGDTVAGTTSNPPGAADGQNVIGIGDLPPGTLGLTQTRSSQRETPVAATRTCAPSAREPTDTVLRRNRTQFVRLRHDRIVGGRVRRATVRRKLRVPTYSLRRGPAMVQLCVIGAATTAVTPTLEYDVSLRLAPTSGPWTLGPAAPSSSEFDFETNTLHELGHVSGLAHQLNECDPSTPMPASQAPQEFWHAPVAGEWFRPAPCPPNPSPPAPVNGSDSVEPLPGAGARSLAGRSILINPHVPPGYDSARFVAVADRAIRRAGGTVAGATDIAPANGDGNSVLGFATLPVGTLSSASSTPRTQLVDAYNVKSCRKARVRVRRQSVVRKFVRVGALGLRRDAVATRRRIVSGYRCTRVTRPSQSTPLPSELDLRINERTIAWEFGPRLPVDGTRWDLETALLQDVMSVGAPAGTPCDATTPNSSAGSAAGDWWRSSSEVRRDRCLAGGAPNVERARALRSAGSARGGEVVHEASGLPDDVVYEPSG